MSWRWEVKAEGTAAGKQRLSSEKAKTCPGGESGITMMMVYGMSATASAAVRLMVRMSELLRRPPCSTRASRQTDSTTSPAKMRSPRQQNRSAVSACRTAWDTTLRAGQVGSQRPNLLEQSLELSRLRGGGRGRPGHGHARFAAPARPAARGRSHQSSRDRHGRRVDLGLRERRGGRELLGPLADGAPAVDAALELVDAHGRSRPLPSRPARRRPLQLARQGLGRHCERQAQQPGQSLRPLLAQGAERIAGKSRKHRRELVKVEAAVLVHVGHAEALLQRAPELFLWHRREQRRALEEFLKVDPTVAFRVEQREHLADAFRAAGQSTLRFHDLQLRVQLADPRVKRDGLRVEHV
eukprot:scaffold3906_cov120-Isochrysis_galbana.AAC.8